MKKHYVILIIAIFCAGFKVLGQEVISKPTYLRYFMDSATKASFQSSLDTFFAAISKGEVREDLLTENQAKLSKIQLKQLVKHELFMTKDTLAPPRKKTLINVFPISEREYSIRLSYTGPSKHAKSTLIYIAHLIARKEPSGFTFSIPLNYETKYWNQQTVGYVTYYFRGKLNLERAKIFNQKNMEIANKFGLEPDSLHFYMCDNYQEIMGLLGLEYSFSYNGLYRDGYGVVENTILSVMHNEDFSHDMVHYYSRKINPRKDINWIAEEGFAYAWGNAYYTDKSGEMVTLDQLVEQLKVFMKENPNYTLSELIRLRGLKIFHDLAPEASVRSTIAGVIAREVEKQKGQKGVQELITADGRLDEFLITAYRLLGLTDKTFDQKVGRLLQGQ